MLGSYINFYINDDLLLRHYTNSDTNLKWILIPANYVGEDLENFEIQQDEVLNELLMLVTKVEPVEKGSIDVYVM